MLKLEQLEHVMKTSFDKSHFMDEKKRQKAKQVPDPKARRPESGQLSGAWNWFSP